MKKDIQQKTKYLFWISVGIGAVSFYYISSILITVLDNFSYPRYIYDDERYDSKPPFIIC